VARPVHHEPVQHEPVHHEPVHHAPAHRHPAPVAAAPIPATAVHPTFGPTPAPARLEPTWAPPTPAPAYPADAAPPSPYVATVPAVPAQAEYATAGLPVGPPLQASQTRPRVPDADLASSALSELRGLYEPSFTPVAVPAADTAGLARRTRRTESVPQEQPTPAAPRRTRNPAEVRGMLSGFRAGVERGRTNHPDDGDAPQSPDAPTS
jgi:hypothetical protein